MARTRDREICRPDQANRATAVTSASFFGADDSTGCQRDNAGLRRSGKGAASVQPTSCAMQASRHRPMKKTRARWCIRLVMMALLLANTTTAQTAPPAEKPGKPLSPEAEMAIMRVMNLENRIQTLQTVPVKMTDNELAGHFSGTWICFTTMRLNGQLGRGIMEIRLEQEGDELTGDGG